MRRRHPPPPAAAAAAPPLPPRAAIAGRRRRRGREWRGRLWRRRRGRGGGAARPWRGWWWRGEACLGRRLRRHRHFFFSLFLACAARAFFSVRGIFTFFSSLSTPIFGGNVNSVSIARRAYGVALERKKKSFFSFLPFFSLAFTSMLFMVLTLNVCADRR